MKRALFVVALAVALTMVLAATAFATSPKTWDSHDYYTWNTVGSRTGNTLSSIGTNPANPGVHANYSATTAKCGICHSVHRASATGNKLLASAVTTCGGCHATQGGVITTKLVTWGEGTGPHHSDVIADCLVRGCHASTPHGAGVSTHALFASKLINVGVDQVLANDVTAGNAGFALSDLEVVGSTLSAAQQKALLDGYTCNQVGCHTDTQLAVIVKDASGLRAGPDPLENEAALLAEMDTAKTGHLTVAAAVNAAGSYAAVDGCTSCHNQTDSNSTSGFAFPHGQTVDAASTTNLGVARVYLWMGFGAYTGAAQTPQTTQDMKAYDGNCLKCHRGANGLTGIGIDH